MMSSKSPTVIVASPTFAKTLARRLSSALGGVSSASARTVTDIAVNSERKQEDSSHGTAAFHAVPAVKRLAGEESASVAASTSGSNQ